MTDFQISDEPTKAMKINCVWEHNGNDTLLYVTDH